jgi:hypothetical protein
MLKWGLLKVDRSKCKYGCKYQLVVEWVRSSQGMLVEEVTGKLSAGMLQ